METDDPKPIPAYYCCYLLRSTVRHASLYVGSTPNPSRRLPQHNGDAKGGAKRTSRDNLRPWEMTLVVEGFMSRVGALQFEWAWQHTDRTRHVESDDEPVPDAQSKSSSKSKTTKPKSRTSRRSLTAHLADLHSLLRSPSFATWPLRVRFFCADVYRQWRIWNERVDAGLPADRVILDGDCPRRGGEDAAAVGDINKLPVDYTALEEYLEKSMFVLEDAEDLRCSVCKSSVSPKAEQIVMCPQTSCRAASHLLCLSANFLEVDDDIERFVPSQGTCPACKELVQWPIMMKELSLRNRGEKEAKAILRKKEKRERKTSTKPSTSKKGKQKEVQEAQGSQETQKDSGGTGFIFPSGFDLPP